MATEDSKSVGINAETTEYKLGGVTGKGFLPGQSGNPSGRPKKAWLTEVFEEMLAEKLADPAERKKYKDAQWKKLLSKGVVSTMLLDSAWDRTEGKVAQPVRVSGDLTISLADEMRKARERSERIKSE